MSWMNADGEKIETPRDYAFHPDNPDMVKAAIIRFLMKHDGWTQEQSAKVFGKTQQWVGQVLGRNP